MIARPSIIYNWGNEQTVSFDVAVIGAGPAGSAAAIRMRALGLSVALIERASFPRYHVGICIADQTVGLLHCLLYTSPSPRDRTRSRMPSSA